MKQFKANDMDLESMSRINGGDVEVSFEEGTKIIYTTSKPTPKAVAMENDISVEVSGTITIEK